MYFIKRSVASFFDQLLVELEDRRNRFNQEKTPKRVFSFWFFIIFLGQIGIVTSVIWAGLTGDGMIDALAKQGKSGNFLTFEISLILSCLVYYFEEYGDEPPRALFLLRITSLVLAMLVAFLVMLNYIYINSTTSLANWSCLFVAYNAFLYIASVLLSYFMYITFSVVETTASEDMKAKTGAAINAAVSLSTTTTGSIGQKQINLEG